MKIRLSGREIPSIEQFQKAFQIISEELVDGLLRQVIITPRGRQIRYMDPATNKQVRVENRSFNLGLNSSDESDFVTAGYVGEPFDFAKFKAKAKEMTDQALWFSLRDAIKAKEAMQSMGATAQENWYADEASVYRQEISRRKGDKPVMTSSIKLSGRDEKNFVTFGGPVNWEPLERLYKDNPEVLEDFMYMSSVKLMNNNIIYLYKNSNTRKYINIDTLGNTYEYTGDKYIPIENDIAKIKVMS